MTAAGPEDKWAPHTEQFVDGHYGSLRGRVRTHVVDQHLAVELEASRRDPYRQFSRLFHLVGLRRESH